MKRGLNCQLVLNKTNFYAEDDDQAGDEGIISCEVIFYFNIFILNVYRNALIYFYSFT